MNLEQLKNSLLSGVHDAHLKANMVDYVLRKAVMKNAVARRADNANVYPVITVPLGTKSSQCQCER